MKRSDLLVIVTMVTVMFGYLSFTETGRHVLLSDIGAGGDITVGACNGGKITENVDYCERARKNCKGEYHDASGKIWISENTDEGGGSIGFDWSTATLVDCPGTYNTACFIESGSKVEGTEGTKTTNNPACSNTFKQGNCRMPYWGSTCAERYHSAVPNCTGGKIVAVTKPGC
jgi:hypothetical protein